MPFQSPTAEVCREIVSELEDAVGWFAGGEMTPERFRQCVIVFEAAKLKRFGFSLSSQVAESGMVHFSLRIEESGELCASMNVDPVTGVCEVQYAL